MARGSKIDERPTVFDVSVNPLQPLDAWMRAGPLVDVPETFVIALACKAAEALQWLHGQRDARGRPLYHGHISPGSLLISPQAGVQLDGVVRGSDGRIDLTRSNVRGRGVPGYRSPEQQANEAVDGRTDLFALGLVLVEVIVGAPLSWTDDLRHDGLETHVRALCRGADISRRLTGLLLEMIGLDPRERPPSAREARRGLARLLVGKAPEPRRAAPVHVVEVKAEDVIEDVVLHAAEIIPPRRRASSATGNLAIQSASQPAEPTVAHGFPEIYGFFN